jgi:hypothetical protein
MLLLFEERERRLSGAAPAAVAAAGMVTPPSRRSPPNGIEKNYAYKVKVARKRTLDEDVVKVYDGRPPTRTAAAVCTVLMGDIASEEKRTW